MSGALPRMLTYICTLLVVLIAIGPLMIVWPTTLLAHSCILARQAPCLQGGRQSGIPPSVPSNNATPPFAHIVVVVEENHSFSEIVGNPQAPYINSLASAGVLLTNYHALSHPSEPNYFALYAGSTFGVQDDGNYSEPDPTLATILQGNGESFIGYVESGSPQQHNPWESFPEGVSVERNMSTFPASDFSQLPTVAFVIPNLNDDMHDGTIAQADQWLSINIGAYAQWAVTHQSLLMVVWDEDDGTEGNQVPAILFGANIVSGAYNDAYTHYDLLHTLLDASGLSAPRNAALVPVFGNGIFSAYRLNAIPTSGTPPLVVIFMASGLPLPMTYTINFGDGTTGALIQSSCIGVTAIVGGQGGIQCSGSASHIYTAAGSYSATLLNALGLTVGTVAITVTGAAPNVSFTTTSPSTPRGGD